MDIAFKDRFMGLWQGRFNGADLPVVFYYTDRDELAEKVKPPVGHRCVVADLSRVRAGRSLCFDTGSVGCSGGRRYFGFTEQSMPNFEYFLSYGIPGELEGERYKKSPDLVLSAMRLMPHFKAPAKYIIFKRWDKINAEDDPEVVIFFDRPDVLSGLFTLANYDEAGQYGVFCPFGAGCATIVLYPYLETHAERPRGVLGMFDVSARPCVQPNVLTFAVPMNRFTTMVNNMEESFLITESWEKVKKRIISPPS